MRFREAFTIDCFLSLGAFSKQRVYRIMDGETAVGSGVCHPSYCWDKAGAAWDPSLPREGEAEGRVTVHFLSMEDGLARVLLTSSDNVIEVPLDRLQALPDGFAHAA